MANDRRGSRLLSDLNSAFRRDSQIDEFDFLPVTEPKHNKSPIILVDHKLGLELWSVKLLYQYAYHALMAWRAKQSHRYIEPQELSSMTRAVVLINPDCYTVWNIRKELVESGDISLSEELSLGSLVLSKHPKSSETFIHRKWVLSRYMDSYLSSSQGSSGSTGSNKDGFISMEAIDFSLDAPALRPAENGHGDLPVPSQCEYHDLMRSEMGLCKRAAEKYPCNYYAWSHRIWVVQHCHNCSVQVLLRELQTTEGFVSQHVSDHSGFHYRQFLLSSLGDQSDSLHDQFSIPYTSLLQKEFLWISNLVFTFPGHEAMWCHRKFVFRSLHNEFQAGIGKLSSGKDCDTELVINNHSDITNRQKRTRLESDTRVLEQKEIDSVTKSELMSDNPHQKRLAQGYIDWLRKVVIK